MNAAQTFAVVTPEGQNLNGLGSMVSQYLEQEFEEFPEKAAAASQIRCNIAMEMGKGTAVTLSFLGDRVLVQNGVAAKPDLHIRGEYLVLSGVLCGTTNPIVGVCRGSIKLLGIPRRPFQAMRVLRLLKIRPSPAEEEAAVAAPNRMVFWIGASALVLAASAFLAYRYFR